MALAPFPGLPGGGVFGPVQGPQPAPVASDAGSVSLQGAIAATTAMFAVPVGVPSGWKSPSSSGGSGSNAVGVAEHPGFVAPIDLNAAIRQAERDNPVSITGFTPRDLRIGQLDSAREMADEAEFLLKAAGSIPDSMSYARDSVVDDAMHMQVSAQRVVAEAGFDPATVLPLLQSGELSGRELMREVDLAKAQRLFDSAMGLDGPGLAFEREQMLAEANDLMAPLFLTSQSREILGRFGGSVGAQDIATLVGFEQATRDRGTAVFGSRDPVRVIEVMAQGYSEDAAIALVAGAPSSGVGSLTIVELQHELDRLERSHATNTAAFDATLRELDRRAGEVGGAKYSQLDADALSIAERAGVSYLDAAEAVLALPIQGSPGLADVALLAAREDLAQQVQVLRIEAVNDLTDQIDARPPFARDGLLAERGALLSRMFGDQADKVSAALSAGAPNVNEAYRTVLTAEAVGSESIADVARFERAVDGLGYSDARREVAIDVVAHALLYGVDPEELAVAVQQASTHERGQASAMDGLNLLAVARADEIYSGANRGLYNGVNSHAMAVAILELAEESPGLGSLVATRLADRDDRLGEKLGEIATTELAVGTVFAVGPGPQADPESARSEADRLWAEYFKQVDPNTGIYGSRPGDDGRRLDEIALAFRLLELAKTDPALAAAVHADIDTRLSVTERIQLNKDLSGQSSWGDRLTLADDAPGQFAQGVGKELWNGVAFVGEVAVNYGPTPTGAVNLALAIQGKDSPLIVDIPSFELENLAERGGADAMTMIDIVMLPAGVLKSGPTLGARALSRLGDGVDALRALRNANKAVDPDVFGLIGVGDGAVVRVPGGVIGSVVDLDSVDDFVGAVRHLDEVGVSLGAKTQVDGWELVVELGGDGVPIITSAARVAGDAPAPLVSVAPGLGVDGRIENGVWRAPLGDPPPGVPFDGPATRFHNPEYADDGAFVPSSYAGATHRFTGENIDGAYASIDGDTALAEIAHWGVDPTTRVQLTIDIHASNVLDLTDPGVRRRLGIELADITGDSYVTTQAIGEWAHTAGYDGILAPSARAADGTNLVLLRDVG